MYLYIYIYIYIYMHTHFNIRHTYIQTRIPNINTFNTAPAGMAGWMFVIVCRLAGSQAGGVPSVCGWLRGEDRRLKHDTAKHRTIGQ